MPTAPGSDWSRSPWGRPPSSLPPLKPQLPERNKERQSPIRQTQTTQNADMCVPRCHIIQSGRAVMSCLYQAVTEEQKTAVK